MYPSRSLTLNEPATRDSTIGISLSTQETTWTPRASVRGLSGALCKWGGLDLGSGLGVVAGMERTDEHEKDVGEQRAGWVAGCGRWAGRDEGVGSGVGCASEDGGCGSDG
jgi:hypothetical protein